MELDDLRGFLAVARGGTLTGAASSLGLTQSTLSRRIHRLERALGQPLFERTGRAMVLTDVGTRFLDRASSVVTTLEEAAREFNDAPDTGTVRIGAIPTVAPYLLPRVLSRFARALPAVRVAVQEHTTDALLNAVRDGGVDIAVLARPFDATHLEVEHLYNEELMLLVPASHPLAEHGTVPPRLMHDEPLVLLNSEHCLSDAVGAFCRDRSVEMVGVERVHQLSTLQELVTLGHGVSLVPALAAACDTSKRRVYRSFTRPAPKRGVVAVRNPYRFQQRVAKSLWATLTEHDWLTV
ncbi:MAG: LysR family transcriptional regulator [Planctomycetota bacterium]